MRIEPNRNRIRTNIFTRTEIELTLIKDTANQNRTAPMNLKTRTETKLGALGSGFGKSVISYQIS